MKVFKVRYPGHWSGSYSIASFPGCTKTNDKSVWFDGERVSKFKDGDKIYHDTFAEAKAAIAFDALERIKHFLEMLEQRKKMLQEICDLSEEDV